MEPITFFNRFSALEIEETDREIEDEPVEENEPPIILRHKRPSKAYPRYLPSQKEHFIKKPPFLRIPRELRWMIFDELVASISEIEISPSNIDSFHALRLTTKGLREEVKGWAKKRPDIVNDFPYGYYIPSQTTFVLKIDHRWKKLVKQKIVSGSHVTFDEPKVNRTSTRMKTKGIDYITRKQAWSSFCRTREPQKVANVGLKFEIILSEEFESENFFGSIPQPELFNALSEANWYVGCPWASVRLYIRGSLDQIISIESHVAELRNCIYAIQKAEFDKETWDGFCHSYFKDEDYDSLEYPMNMTYWENERRKIYKSNKRDAITYEFGGLVMAFEAKSAEDMRRGPVQSQSSLRPARDNLQVGSCL
ncbi:hypothetical protein MFRU_004g02670 [Monilinia fructicola]|uniref:F-box domain-containing protein n=1 Tax=Monilinia fructicola TaxID=38448 RepID=A0A5M9JJP7_MONFR|nr:hypothetical protein EYC84_001128 [Monilinia fructicola]KAG4033764.1 hypothetical protein MFRU_004g02670 [Monilinia fructicola]